MARRRFAILSFTLSLSIFTTGALFSVPTLPPPSVLPFRLSSVFDSGTVRDGLGFAGRRVPFRFGLAKSADDVPSALLSSSVKFSVAATEPLGIDSARFRTLPFLVGLFDLLDFLVF